MQWPSLNSLVKISSWLDEDIGQKRKEIEYNQIPECTSLNRAIDIQGKIAMEKINNETNFKNKYTG